MNSNVELHQHLAGSEASIDEVMAVMDEVFDPEFGEAWTRSQCLGILRFPGIHVVLARPQGDSVAAGFALIRLVGEEAELLLIGVRPSRRGQGVGDRLLSRTIDFARSHGVHKLFLEVRDGNTAIQLYEKAGFTRVGLRRAYYKGTNGAQFDAFTFCLQLV